MPKVYSKNTADSLGYHLEYREIEPEWYVWDITGMVIGSAIEYSKDNWEVQWRGEFLGVESNEADGVLVLWNAALKEGGY